MAGAFTTFPSSNFLFQQKMMTLFWCAARVGAGDRVWGACPAPVHTRRRTITGKKAVKIRRPDYRRRAVPRASAFVASRGVAGCSRDSSRYRSGWVGVAREQQEGLKPVSSATTEEGAAVAQGEGREKMAGFGFAPPAPEMDHEELLEEKGQSRRGLHTRRYDAPPRVWPDRTRVASADGVFRNRVAA